MKVLAAVIGNNNYFDPDKLKNAVNDAKAMADVFKRLGYTVIEGFDCNNADYESILRSFDSEMVGYDASIFFYAGHGFQEDGENYLPSIECQVSLADKYSLTRNSIQLTELLNIYKKYNKKTHIAILDACRQRTTLRGGGDTFAPVDAPPGTLIAFSTSPNSTANDGNQNGHGLYTAALLSYIGRERLAVEELFKKVRRTVAQWSNNTQIPWEHTSLIADFNFNTGQMVASPQIPYKEDVVRDAEYNEVGEVADLINEIRISDYNRQNPAIDKLFSKKATDLDKNQQFIFGRNLLQSSSMSYSAQHFMSSLSSNLRKYLTTDGENHVLNGILFEIYFDSHGDFRETGLKRYYFDTIMALRKRPEYNKSFQFIRTVLSPYSESIIYKIPEDDSNLDVDITIHEETTKDFLGRDVVYSIISNVSVNGLNITEKVKRCQNLSRGINEAISIVTKAPMDAISLHANLPLRDYIAFEENNDNPFE